MRYDTAVSETDPPYGAASSARITRQGQITVPKAIRDALGAVPGDEIVFERRGDEIVLGHRRRQSVMELAGIFADTAPRPGLTKARLREAVEEELARKHERRLRTAGERARPHVPEAPP